jgi:GT2 family glycosyltransferase
MSTPFLLVGTVTYRRPWLVLAHLQRLLALSFPLPTVIVLINNDPSLDLLHFLQAQSYDIAHYLVKSSPTATAAIFTPPDFPTLPQLAIAKSPVSPIVMISPDHNLGGAGGIAMLQALARQHTDCSALWLIDDDAEIAHDTFSELWKTHQQLTPTAILGSCMLSLSQRHLVHESGIGYERNTAQLTWFDMNQPYDQINNLPHSCDAVAATSMFIPRSVLEQNGLFANYFIHHDDIEYCLRAGARGIPVVTVPSSRIWHPSVSATKSLFTYATYDVRNHLLLAQAHNPTALPTLQQHYQGLAHYAELSGRPWLSRQIQAGLTAFAQQRYGAIATPQPTYLSPAQLSGAHLLLIAKKPSPSSGGQVLTTLDQPLHIFTMKKYWSSCQRLFQRKHIHTARHWLWWLQFVLIIRRYHIRGLLLDENEGLAPPLYFILRQLGLPLYGIGHQGYFVLWPARSTFWLQVIRHLPLNNREHLT